MIAPVDDGGIYYSEPSEGWARPGQVWWSVPAGLDSFPTWKDVTTVYHEGVPGHHLQISRSFTEQENLNRGNGGGPGSRATPRAGRPMPSG